MSEVHQQDIDDLICEHGAEYLSEDDTFNNIVHDFVKALARVKELEGALMAAWSHLDPDCHSVAWDRCDNALKQEADNE